MDSNDAGAEQPLVGLVGTLLIGCRGPDRPGEVEVVVRGGRESFMAYAQQPLPAGSTVLIIEALPHRSVAVVEWEGLGRVSELG